MKSIQDTRFLVISEIGIGDALTLLPILQTLKSQYPSIRIDMLAPGLYPLKKNVKDIVRILRHQIFDKESLEFHHDWLTSRNYDYVWNTQNEKSIWRQVIDSEGNPNWISAPPHRTWPKKSVLELRVKQLQQLFPDLKTYTNPLLRLTSDQEKQSRDFLSCFPKKQILIAIQPTANDHTKIWPREKFIELTNLFTKDSGISVIFFLNKKEKNLFSPQCLPQRPNLHVLIESLDKVIPILTACHLFIGNDSGFYHLAYGLGLPVIGIYRSQRNMKVWSYHSVRSEAVYFYLPSQIRRHWHKCISVKHVLKKSESLFFKHYHKPLFGNSQSVN